MPKSQTPPSPPFTGRMARFTLQNGMVLEIHIPDAAAVETAESPTLTAGFILRSGDEIANIGVLSQLFP
jgi:hypothetical protein